MIEVRQIVTWFTTSGWTTAHEIESMASWTACGREVRRAAWERQGKRVRRRAAVRHRYRSVLSPDQVTRLRAAVACVGCGAAREDIPGARKAPYTRIRHRKGCPVARNREWGAP